MADSFAKSFKEKTFDEEKSLRHRAEIKNVSGTHMDEQKLWRNPASPGATAEHSVSYDERVERVKFLVDNQFCRDDDKMMFRKYLKTYEKYQKMGLQLGMLFGAGFYFAPGIRRLPFYFRIPAAGGMFMYMFNFGRNYGRDVLYVRTKPMIENYERYSGIRHNHTGY